MTRGLTLSVVLHIALIVFTIIGLPRLFKPEPIEDRLMVVDVVTVGSVTNAPPPAEAAKKPDAPTQTAKANPESPKAPPPPPSSAAAPPPPPPIEPPRVDAPKIEVPKAEPPKPQTARSVSPLAEPVPAPKPRPAAVASAEPVPLPKPKPPEARQPDPEAEAVPLPKSKPLEKPKPEPEPEAVPLPKPKPKPEEVKKPEPVPEAPKPVEAAKPEPPKQEPPKVESEAVKAAEVSPEPPPPLPVSRPTPPKRPAKEQVAAKDAPTLEKDKKPDKTDDFLNVLKTVQKMKDTAATPAESENNAPKTSDSTARRSNFDADRPLSVSEMDAIRQQIARCWLVPAGAKQGESLAVEIQVRMNPDRTVRDAEVVDYGRMRSDPFFRAAAESALRALRNPSCTPLNLPPEKYETWKSFTITFDPKDMLS